MMRKKQKLETAEREKAPAVFADGVTNTEGVTPKAKAVIDAISSQFPRFKIKCLTANSTNGNSSDNEDKTPDNGQNEGTNDDGGTSAETHLIDIKVKLPKACIIAQLKKLTMRSHSVP